MTVPMLDMPRLSLIDTCFIDRWDVAEADDAPGTVTRLEIRPDATICEAVFRTSATLIEPGTPGSFTTPLALPSGPRPAGQKFRVASVFTLDGTGRFFALTDEDSIFALAFTGPLPPLGTALNLRTTDRRAIALLHEQEKSALLCFTPGALILTDTGPRPVETIRPGDQVVTRDRGLQEVRWYGETTLDADTLARKPHLRPVMLKRNAIAAGIPARDMAVSPNHHLLINNWRAELLFGEKEVLLPAGAMLNDRTIRYQTGTDPVHYIHLMCVRHEVLTVNGMETESFQPGPEAIAALDPGAREALLTAFPQLRTAPSDPTGPTARRLLKPSEARILMERAGI